jgi:hypothetical protein
MTDYRDLAAWCEAHPNDLVELAAAMARAADAEWREW